MSQASSSETPTEASIVVSKTISPPDVTSASPPLVSQATEGDNISSSIVTASPSKITKVALKDHVSFLTPEGPLNEDCVSLKISSSNGQITRIPQTSTQDVTIHNQKSDNDCFSDHNDDNHKHKNIQPSSSEPPSQGSYLCFEENNGRPGYVTTSASRMLKSPSKRKAVQKLAERIKKKYKTSPTTNEDGNELSEAEERSRQKHNKANNKSSAGKDEG